MSVEFIHQQTNSHTNRVDFTVRIGADTHHFGIAEATLEDLEKKVFRTDIHWMRAFQKHKPVIRKAVEACLQSGGADGELGLIRLERL